jgi:hypothetical protein
MAHVYIYSSAAGAGTGADWANAYTTAAAALAAKAAGDNFWVAHDHAESAAGNKIHTSPGTISAPCTVICVNRSGSVPPVSADYRTTATVTTTGAFNILFEGYAYFYGIGFSAGSGAVNAGIYFLQNANGAITMKSCTLSLPRTLGLYNAIIVGQNSNTAHVSLTLDNVPISFGSTSDGIYVGLTNFTWINTASALPGSVPDALFYNANATITCRGVDLSAMGSGKNLTYAAFNGDVTFDRCKLGASVVFTPGAGYSAFLGSNIYVLNSDSGATNYRNEKWTYCGSQVRETTIVRTGGSSDGVTSAASKIVTTADAKWIAPYEAMPLTVWCDTVGSVTVTVYGIWGGGAVPNNDDIWIEVGYLGSAASPVATTDTSNGKANYLATATAQAADAGSTWGGSTTKFKMAVTVTTAMKGLIKVYPKAGKFSSTFYLDEKPVLT